MPSRLAKKRRTIFTILSLALLALVACPLGWDFAMAEEYVTKAEFDAGIFERKVAVDTLWVLVAGCLVFFMNAGFGMLETGFNRQKNAVNILSKNFVVFAIATLSFWVIGWGLMFGDGNGFMGTEGLFFLSGEDSSPAGDDTYKGVYGSIAWATVYLPAKFFFQLVFAGTAATIVSGAVAERVKYGSFLIFSLLLVAFIYPITGHWAWGGGFLGSIEPGFSDFAGSTVVHSVGGWAALAGVIMLGPRIGRFGKDGKAKAMPGHNMMAATLGGMILWLGWFGFNPGSEMAVDDVVPHVFVTTNMAGIFGILSATITSWLFLGKPDLSMTINGLLAGLVAITAPCAAVSVPGSAAIGFIAGIIVVFAVLLLEQLHLDDPVGAIPVHLINGIWGTLAVGLFATDGGLFYGGGFAQTWSQIRGIVAVGGYTFGMALIFWFVLKMTIGIRVTAEEEQQGLDISEHGNQSYPDFSLTSR